ncbi:cyclophilin [Trichosporon asahii var. asahii CBS 2479]|uniref:Cyclophilin n=1 Tax=Trichosporon asahii var. asahii (strain ATCC 90039 / CBS 2479 / JCM 2466 / KCTC 7840 / NBRC 103889/ NCYC 2677 / UAMH 7654) TaxID=1186058 RepID=J4U994_TRIAS|nr:cyclophilin [Trichosporon asahii var. asahii CBS 2479]EJT47185.1 cyclophilin [Trichosporon asahii var. asahii CBS 2479]
MDTKKPTVYVAGFPAQVDENQLLEAFVTFGDILEINIPHEPHERDEDVLNDLSAYSTLTSTATKHRGYAFITFANPADAQEAIDNYDLNELPAYRGQGKFLKCSIAAPNKYGTTGEKAVWESEQWLQEHGAGKGTPTAANGDAPAEA